MTSHDRLTYPSSTLSPSSTQSQRVSWNIPFLHNNGPSSDDPPRANTVPVSFNPFRRTFTSPADPSSSKRDSVSFLPPTHIPARDRPQSTLTLDTSRSSLTIPPSLSTFSDAHLLTPIDSEDGRSLSPTDSYEEESSFSLSAYMNRTRGDAEGGEVNREEAPTPVLKSYPANATSPLDTSNPLFSRIRRIPPPQPPLQPISPRPFTPTTPSSSHSSTTTPRPHPHTNVNVNYSRPHPYEPLRDSDSVNSEVLLLKPILKNAGRGRERSASTSAELPANLSFLRDLCVELWIDQEGFRAIRPQFLFNRYCAPRQPPNENANSNAGGGKDFHFDFATAEFSTRKRQSWHFHHAALDSPPILHRLTLSGDDTRDFISRQAYLSIKANGVYSVKGTEDKGRISWKFDYLVDDRRVGGAYGGYGAGAAVGVGGMKGEKTFTPLSFTCTPHLLLPSQGKKIKLFQVFKKGVMTPKLWSYKLDPPALLGLHPTSSTSSSTSTTTADTTGSSATKGSKGSKKLRGIFRNPSTNSTSTFLDALSKVVTVSRPPSAPSTPKALSARPSTASMRPISKTNISLPVRPSTAGPASAPSTLGSSSGFNGPGPGRRAITPKSSLNIVSTLPSSSAPQPLTPALLTRPNTSTGLVGGGSKEASAPEAKPTKRRGWLGRGSSGDRPATSAGLTTPSSTTPSSAPNGPSSKPTSHNPSPGKVQIRPSTSGGEIETHTQRVGNKIVSAEQIDAWMLGDQLSIPSLEHASARVRSRPGSAGPGADRSGERGRGGRKRMPLQQRPNTSAGERGGVSEMFVTA